MSALRFLAFLILMCTMLRTGSAQETRPPSETPGFARMEAWQCPAENQARFLDYVATVWTPLFDEMVREGLFTSWSSLTPESTRDVDFRGREATVVTVDEEWSWTGLWQGPDRERFQASWREYHRRLGEREAEGPGPDQLCTRVRIATYGVN